MRVSIPLPPPTLSASITVFPLGVGFALGVDFVSEEGAECDSTVEGVGFAGSAAAAS